MRIIAFVIYGIFTATLFLSCENKQKSELNKPGELPGHITLIFNNAPRSKDFPGPGNYGFSTFFKTLAFYYDDNLIKREINVERNTSDTISIKTNQPYLEIIHDHQSVDHLNYYFKNGDTLIFNYDNYNPWVTSKDTSITENILNYELVKRKFFSDSFYTTAIKYIYPVYFIMHKVRTTPKDSMDGILYEFKQEAGEKLMSELSKERQYLDSLKSVIPEEIYSFHKTTINSYQKMYVANNSFPGKPSMKFGLSKSTLTKPQVLAFVKSGDQKLKYSAYREFLNTYIDRKYKDKMPLLSFGNTSTWDNRALYDSIVKDTIFPLKVKKYELFQNLLMIAENFSNEDIATYLHKFENTIGDTILTAYLKNKYLLDFGTLKKETTGTYLINISKKKFTLDSLLQQNKGKLIYIDFWASWCSPCRAAMPASQKLRNKYKNKDVTFLYLSIDRDYNSWKKASEEEGLLLNENSFITVNYPIANYYKELKLRSIPRYILYNKVGKLVYPNAPGPGGHEIEKLIDKYLAE